MKRVLAVLSGCIVGVLVIFLSQGIGNLLYPPPPNLDPNNLEQLKEFIATLPAMSFMIVLIGYFLGAFVAGLIATAIIKGESKTPALIAATILTVLGLINVLTIPHPIWFVICDLVVYFAGAYMAYLTFTKFKKNA